MTDLSTLRLNLLRSGYALITIGLGIQIWSQLLNPGQSWELQESVVVSMLGALAVLSLLGLRHPLKMLPILLFEVLWKAIWLSRVALPLWVAGTLDAATASVVAACAVVVLVIVVMPWDYILSHYVLAPGERWLGRRRASAGPQAAQSISPFR